MTAPTKACCLLWYPHASAGRCVVAVVHCSGPCCAIQTGYGVHVKCYLRQATALQQYTCCTVQVLEVFNELGIKTLPVALCRCWRCSRSLGSRLCL